MLENISKRNKLWTSLSQWACVGLLLLVVDFLFFLIIWGHAATSYSSCCNRILWSYFHRGTPFPLVSALLVRWCYLVMCKHLSRPGPVQRVHAPGYSVRFRGRHIIHGKLIRALRPGLALDQQQSCLFLY